MFFTIALNNIFVQRYKRRLQYLQRTTDVEEIREANFLPELYLLQIRSERHYPASYGEFFDSSYRSIGLFFSLQ